VRTFVTSDLHFGHKNIMRFCPATRGHFPDTDVMREAMIAEWNATVAPEDLVYLLGDVAFLPAAEAVRIMRRLNGRKILIEGNHDRKLLNDPVFRSCFESVHNYLRLNYNGQLVILFHYPIAEFDQMHRGAVHLHGHLHGNPSGLEHYRVRDMGYDATGRIVTLMDDAIADALKGAVKGHH
jgi:calcineurin-like phosphoesterase family protein